MPQTHLFVSACRYAVKRDDLVAAIPTDLMHGPLIDGSKVWREVCRPSWVQSVCHHTCDMLCCVFDAQGMYVKITWCSKIDCKPGLPDSGGVCVAGLAPFPRSFWTPPLAPCLSTHPASSADPCPLPFPPPQPPPIASSLAALAVEHARLIECNELHGSQLTLPPRHGPTPLCPSHCFIPCCVHRTCEPTWQSITHTFCWRGRWLTQTLRCGAPGGMIMRPGLPTGVSPGTPGSPSPPSLPIG